MLYDEFIKVLKEIDLLILTEIYRQRDEERFAKTVSSSALYKGLLESMKENVIYIREKYDVVHYLEQIGPEDSVIVFMGAGDIDNVARTYVGQ